MTLCLPLGSTCSVWILPSLRIQCIERHGRISEACSLQQILFIERWCYALFACKFHLDLNRKPILTRIQTRYEYEPVLHRLYPKNGVNSPMTCLALTPTNHSPSEVTTTYRSAFSMRSSTALFMLPSQLCSALIRHMWRHFPKKNTFRWCTCGFSVSIQYQKQLAVWPYPSYG